MKTTPTGFDAQGKPEISCQACVDFILDYIEGVLPAQEKATFERHMNICPNCVTFVENYKKTAAMAQTVGTSPEDAPPVPAKLVEAILKARKHGH